jgi:hypothetical protein
MVRLPSPWRLPNATVRLRTDRCLALSAGGRFSVHDAFQDSLLMPTGVPRRSQRRDGSRVRATVPNCAAGDRETGRVLSYFDDPTRVNRWVLSWAVTARRQIDAWERTLADVAQRQLRHEPVDPSLLLTLEADHHLALLAVGNLIRAIRLGTGDYGMTQDLSDRLIEARDLWEHWDANMPVFLGGEGEPPRPSGKRFAARHPGVSPYDPGSWHSSSGPQLARGVPASEVHAVLDSIERAICEAEPHAAELIPARGPSPWMDDAEEVAHRWFPRGFGDDPASENAEGGSP